MYLRFTIIISLTQQFELFKNYKVQNAQLDFREHYNTVIKSNNVRKKLTSSLFLRISHKWRRITNIIKSMSTRYKKNPPDIPITKREKRKICNLNIRGSTSIVSFEFYFHFTKHSVII